MEQYLGEIRMFGGNFAPYGWAFCNGQLLSIQENEALFSIIGTTYGGDGMSNFAVPNIQGRAPLGSGVLVGTSYVQGMQKGTPTVTLTTANLPPHSHPVTATVPVNSATAGANTPENNFFGVTDNEYAATTDGTAMAADITSVTLQPTGSGVPLNNMQPYLAVSFIIALEGLYPSHS